MYSKFVPYIISKFLNQWTTYKQKRNSIEILRSDKKTSKFAYKAGEWNYNHNTKQEKNIGYVFFIFYFECV